MVASAHSTPEVGGASGQALPSASSSQPAAVLSVTVQVPALHVAVVRHCGRGSSPQLQCANTPANGGVAAQGSSHAEFGCGGAAGHSEVPVLPPLPPADAPPVELPPLDAPPVELPPLDAPPVALPPIELPPLAEPALADMLPLPPSAELAPLPPLEFPAPPAPAPA
jgi:hypothetical protein